MVVAHQRLNIYWERKTYTAQNTVHANCDKCYTGSTRLKWGKRNTGKNTVNWGGLIMFLKTVFEYAEGKGKPKPRKRDEDYVTDL